jgi:hypothetical protein
MSNDSNAKLWKHNPGSDSAHKVGDGFASVQGSQDNGFFSDAKLGNFVKGPLSITGGPENIRINGFWTLNPQLLSCIPSTIVTPVSVLNFDMPLSGALELMKEATAMMATLTIGLA